MLVVALLFGLLLVALGIFLRAKGWRLLGGIVVATGGLVCLLGTLAFIVALLNFHP